MIADRLTKKMKADALWPAMHGKIDLTPTPDSVLAKLRKQKLRRKTEAEDDGEGEPQPEAATAVRTTRPGIRRGRNCLDRFSPRLSRRNGA